VQKTVFLCGAILGLTLTASAQDLPKFDVFGGYSYTRLNFNDSNINTNGGVGSVAVYPGKRFGIVGDFGGSKLSKVHISGTTFDVDGNVVSYLFGPRVRFGTRAVTPFAQILFGGAHHGDVTTTNAQVCRPASPPCNVAKSENAFAMTAEGGIDIGMGKHFAIRGQGGYLMTRFKDNGSTSTQNDARVSVGIVIR